jgi:hypothetical protein
LCNVRFFYYDDNILDAAGAGRGAEAGMWHFVSVTMTATGRGKLYVDSQPPVSFATASRPAPDESFTLGMDMSEDGPAAFFHGQMDEVRKHLVLIVSEATFFFASLGLFLRHSFALTIDIGATWPVRSWVLMFFPLYKYNCVYKLNGDYKKNGSY